MRFLPKLCVGFVVLCLISTTACRSSNWQTPDSVATLQAERRAKVQKSVGLKRSEAELKLAQDAWAFGDRTACLAALNGILEREPGHVEALLLKAEVHLAKDELVEADRAIAIAVSHDPKNAKAKRLTEIARTKQLAERPKTPVRPPVDPTPAPLPGNAVARSEYSHSSAGIAQADDLQPTLPSVTPPRAEALPPVGARVADASQATRTANVEGVGFFENSELPAMPTLPVTDEPLAGTADVKDSTEKAPASLALGQPGDLPAVLGTDEIAEAEQSMPVILGPEEAAALGLSDGPGRAVEITDGDDCEGLEAEQSEFLSAIGAGDSAAALSAVEAELTANPDDPQIPITATVAALEANQAEMAASIARLGIAFHPSSAGLHRTLGAALYRSGNYSSSQVALQQALSLDNSSALSYFLMGCVSEKLGDTEAAETHFARAAELDPTIADGV